jgi:hypothetical protein
MIVAFGSSPQSVSETLLPFAYFCLEFFDHHDDLRTRSAEAFLRIHRQELASRRQQMADSKYQQLMMNSQAGLRFGGA